MSATTKSQSTANSAIPFWKTEVVPFMLWEGFKYCKEHLTNIKTLVESIPESDYNSFVKHISDMRRHFQLMNFPIIACLFLKEELKFNTLDTLVQKAEHVLSAAYFIPLIYKNALIDDPTYQEAMDIVSSKGSIIPSTIWFDTSRNTDQPYIQSIVNDILNKTKENIQFMRNNYYHPDLASWKKHSPFNGMDPDDIINKLRGYTIMQLLSTVNSAMACGVSREDIEMLIIAAIQAGGSVLPIKFFMCAYENMRLCKVDLVGHYIEDGETEKIELLQSSKYSLDKFLTEELVSKLAAVGKIPDKFLAFMDDSGSQSSHMHRSALPISKWQFSAMMVFELIHSASNVNIALTGRIGNVRPVKHTTEEMRKMSMIELYYHLTSQAQFDDGIYVGNTFKSLSRDPGKFSFNEKDTNIIILADDGDSNPYDVYPHKDVAFPNNKSFYVNVEKTTAYNVENTPQFMLSITGYSDYWFEPIKMCLNRNSGMAKNMDEKGFSFRGEE